MKRYTIIVETTNSCGSLNDLFDLERYHREGKIDLISVVENSTKSKNTNNSLANQINSVESDTRPYGDH